MNKSVLTVITAAAALLLTTTPTPTICTTTTTTTDDDPTTIVVVPINDEMSLQQKLIKLTNSSKSDKPWLLDYKTMFCSTFSEPDTSFIHLLLLAEPQSMARPRNLELIVKDDKNFEFNYEEILNEKGKKRTVTTPSFNVTININKCTPLDYLEELRKINISLDKIPDLTYGNILDDNTSIGRAKLKYFPKLKPKTSFKLLTRDFISKKNNVYYIYIYLTTLKEHFDHYFSKF